ncbi:MAG: LLM class flavin-dependent oxidoreductase [Chloroflexota bacterium]
MAVPVGINVWSRLVDKTFPYLDQVVAPFDSIWMPDHVQYNGHDVAEGWTLLAYALGRYPDKVVGHDVLCNSFRNPALLAKMVSTAQAISGGRVVLGIGAGWNEEEYRAYGWPFPSAKVRIEQLAEAIEVIRLMWSDYPANYEGKYYQLKNAHCEPKPNPIPPIMVGAEGERYSLRVVAQHADWWNHLYKGRENMAHKQNVIKAHCKDVGRDYDEILQVIHAGICIAPNEKELTIARNRPDARPLGDNDIVGTPEQITEEMLGAVEQGAKRFSVHFWDSPQPEGAYLFASTVLPYLAEVQL